MAGDWLKMECGTPDKPEVLALTARLGWDDPDLTVGKLFRLWRWFDQHTIDGNAAGVTAALLDRIVGVTGFCEAMAFVGWLEIAEDGISLPDFHKHNGNTAKNRALTARRVASHKASATGNGSDGQDEAGQSQSGNASIVSGALPREREEKKEIQPPSPRGGRDGSSGLIGFDTFWSNWPKSERKGGKSDCLKVWKRDKLEADTDVIVAHVNAMKRSKGWTKDEGAFIPAPVVYLRGGKWDGAEMDLAEAGTSEAGFI